MASSKTTTTVALFLSLNLLLFSTTTTHARNPYTPTVPSGSGGGSGSSTGTCPVDALKLGVCANLLGDLLNLQVGSPPVQPCCTLIEGLADLEAAVCLCTLLRANVLKLVNLSLPVNLSLLLNVCERKAPRGFLCP